MALRLTLSGGGRGTRTLASGTLSIGRGERNDWKLPDPERILSNTHCVISVEHGQYILTDLSTNGVHINGAQEPTARDSRVVLTDGDSFRLGDYTVTVAEVEMAADPGAPPTILDRDTDPLMDPMTGGTGSSFPFVDHRKTTPTREDPFRPESGEDDSLFPRAKPQGGWEGPSRRDDADGMKHAMKLSPGVSAVNAFDIIDNIIEEMTGPGKVDVPKHSDPVSPEPHTLPPTRPIDGDAMQAALRVVLEGAGVADAPLPKSVHADAEATLRAMGQVFRALTEGLREVLMARATVKGELAADRTWVKPESNNPLKFSLSTDDAVVALLTARRTGYLPPLAAAREACNDIKLHELAVIAGMQAALTDLLDRFDPKTLESKLAGNMLASVVPATRKAQLWDNFRQLYKSIAGEAEDDFHKVFGQAFARAYTAHTQRD